MDMEEGEDIMDYEGVYMVEEDASTNNPIEQV
jgi:hypothetical protein